MRIRRFSARMIPLLLVLLAGCTGRQSNLEDRFAAFRDSLCAANTVSFELALHCSNGQTVDDYVLRADAQLDHCRVTVVEPAILAGVTAAVSANGEELGFEGVSLGVGSYASLTPASAASAMVKTMRYGYEELLWREDDYLVARLWMDSGAVMTLWLDENAAPVCAEIGEDGAVAMSAVFTGWTLSGAEQ